MSKNKKKRNRKSKTTSKLEIVRHFDILRVDWYDHVTGNHSWRKYTEIDSDLPVCTTVGLKVYEDEKVIVLAQNASTLEHIADTTTIVKSCILGDGIIKLGELRYVKQDGE